VWHTLRVTADPTIRIALWFSVALNLLGTVLFASIAAGHPLMPMPIMPPPFFAAQVALTIALFGGVYAWLALQPSIDGPLLVVSAIGKLGFFALFVIYRATGDLPWSSVMQASPDLILGVVYLWWLRSRSTRAHVPHRRP
jgi:hypothetical protein